jgi:protein Tex
VKSPHDVVSVGDVVTVWVMGVDQERKRVSLTMVKPGTERQRGQQGAGARRGPGGPGEPREGDRGNRGQGQGRRGGGGPTGGARPPRPAGSALTSPPVGSPSVAILAETPAARRPERDRGGPAAGPGGPRFSDNRGQGSGPSGHGGGPPRQGQQVQGHDSGPQGRGGPRGPYPGQGSGDRRQDRGPNPRPPGRPSRPSPPPPPLSKDALAGNVPLRTFGQLKQLWEAKVEPKDESAPGVGGEMPQSLHAADHGSADAAPPPQDGSEAPNPASAAPAETDSQAASS